MGGIINKLPCFTYISNENCKEDSLVENMVKKNRSRFPITVLLTTFWFVLHQT